MYRALFDESLRRPGGFSFGKLGNGSIIELSDGLMRRHDGFSCKFGMSVCGSVMPVHKPYMARKQAMSYPVYDGFVHRPTRTESGFLLLSSWTAAFHRAVSQHR